MEVINQPDKDGRTTWYEHINSLPDDLVAVFFGNSRLLQDAGVFFKTFSMRQPTFYAAVFWIIRDKDWKVLVIKRKNTGHMDGWYGLPAWHIEWTETPQYAMTREILEEVWLSVREKDLKLINVAHRINADRVTVDFYFEVASYSGEPENAEPEKSEWIYWIDWQNEEQFQSREALKKIELWETYSEIDYRQLGF